MISQLLMAFNHSRFLGTIRNSPAKELAKERSEFSSPFLIICSIILLIGYSVFHNCSMRWLCGTTYPPLSSLVPATIGRSGRLPGTLGLRSRNRRSKVTARMERSDPTRKLSRGGMCLFHNSSQVAQIRAAASAHDGEMREFFAKSTDQLSKFFGIAFVKLFRLEQRIGRKARQVDSVIEDESGELSGTENRASPLLLQFPSG